MNSSSKKGILQLILCQNLAYSLLLGGMTIITIATGHQNQIFTNQPNSGLFGDKALILAHAWYIAQINNGLFYFNTSGWGGFPQLLGINKMFPLLSELKPPRPIVIPTTQQQIQNCFSKKNICMVNNPWNRNPWGPCDSLFITPVNEYFQENLVDALCFDRNLHEKFRNLFLNAAHSPKKRIASRDEWHVGVHIRKHRLNGKELGLHSLQYYSNHSTTYNHITSSNEILSAKKLLLQNKPYPTNAFSIDQMLKQADHLDQVWPGKFLPEQYYLDQIIALQKIVNKPLKAFVFSDSDCEKICNNFAIQLSQQNSMMLKKITFIPVLSPKNTLGMLTDLFLLADCDALIRSGSHFACFAQLIGKHKIVIRPAYIEWINNCLVASHVFIYDYTSSHSSIIRINKDAQKCLVQKK